MVYANGRLPAPELREVWGGMRLPIKAADAWDAMWAAAKADGVELIPTSDQVAPWTNPPGAGTGMYRDYSLQRWMYAVRGKAACAAPGYSVHGTLPGCVDIYNEPSPRVRVWLDENAARFGWHRTIKSESWHFQFGTSTAGGIMSDVWGTIIDRTSAGGNKASAGDRLGGVDERTGRMEALLGKIGSIIWGTVIDRTQVAGVKAAAADRLGGIDERTGRIEPLVKQIAADLSQVTTPQIDQAALVAALTDPAVTGAIAKAVNDDAARRMRA